MTAHDCRVVQGVPASTSLWVKAILSELVAGLIGGSEDTTRRGWPGFMANLRKAWDYMGLYGIIMDCNGIVVDYQWDSCEIQWDYSSKEVFRSSNFRQYGFEWKFTEI